MGKHNKHSKKLSPYQEGLLDAVPDDLLAKYLQNEAPNA